VSIFFSFFVCRRQPTTTSALSSENDFIFSEDKLKDFLRCALLDTNQSPWQKLYYSRNEQSLLSFTGFNYASFDYMLSKFQPLYPRYSPTSLRQSAEWGMRAIQGSFPRLKDTLLFSEEMTDCKALLNLLPMLLNFRTWHVGLNQLTATYYPTFHLVGDDVLDMFLN
jgi:hypothetical protein